MRNFQTSSVNHTFTVIPDFGTHVCVPIACFMSRSTNERLVLAQSHEILVDGTNRSQCSHGLFLESAYRLWSPRCGIPFYLVPTNSRATITHRSNVPRHGICTKSFPVFTNIPPCPSAKHAHKYGETLSYLPRLNPPLKQPNQLIQPLNNNMRPLIALQILFAEALDQHRQCPGVVARDDVVDAVADHD